MDKAKIIDYIEALQLDDIVKELTAWERLQASQYRAGRSEVCPKRLMELETWRQAHRFHPPAMKYDINRELVYFDAEAHQWRPVSAHELYNKKII